MPFLKKHIPWNKGLTRSDPRVEKNIRGMSLGLKGHVPWNKGKSVRLNPKGEFKKGLIPWNKNKKGVMPTPWNKNMKGIHLSPKSEFKKGLIPWTKSQKGIHLSPKSEFKKGDTRIVGKNNYFWKGGITPINQVIRTSVEYKFWRQSIFERDNYTCIWCLEKGGVLHADHIKPFALYPELRFAIDNGRTLCKECHKTTDTYAGRTRK